MSRCLLACTLTLAALSVLSCSRSAPAGAPSREPEPTTAAPAPPSVAAASSPAVPASPSSPPPSPSPQPALEIVDAPMAWSEERAALTLDYRRRHSDADAQNLDIEPRVVVLHYTGGGSARGTRRYFDAPRIERERAQLARAGAVNVSAHFVVDRDGTIYRLQPETRFARHCIGLNHVAIGVENVGDGAKWPLTDAQVAANIALVRDLAARYPITHLVGHHEVMAMRNHELYREREPGYRNSKPDPGAAFMARVRAEVGELHGPSS